MTARAPTTKALSASREIEEGEARLPYVPDEAGIARWAAWYEGLPAEFQDAIDEMGQASKPRPLR